MSLLTSGNTPQDQLKFLNKLQRHYHRRGGSQYLPREKKQIFSFTTKIDSLAVRRIEDIMEDFMAKVKDIIKEFNKLDHYCVLEMMRKHSFFSDIATLLSIDQLEKLSTLSKELAAKEDMIKDLRKDLFLMQNDQTERIDKFQEKQKIKYNPAKNMASNLYYHARGLSEEEFIKFYNQVCLSNNVTLKKVQKSNVVNSESDLIEKLNEFMEYGRKSGLEDELEELTNSVRELTLAKNCRKPCCVEQEETRDQRVNKAHLIMKNTVSYSKSKNVYKTDKSEQYFKRYYRAGSFNHNDITSVSRTRMQEMERLEGEYKRNLKQRIKKQDFNQMHRYSHSSVRD